MTIDPNHVSVVNAPDENETVNPDANEDREDDPDTCWIVDRRTGREDVRMRIEDWPAYAKREGL